MILANEYNTFQLKRQEKLDIALVVYPLAQGVGLVVLSHHLPNVE